MPNNANKTSRSVKDGGIQLVSVKNLPNGLEGSDNAGYHQERQDSSDGILKSLAGDRVTVGDQSDKTACQNGYTEVGMEEVEMVGKDGDDHNDGNITTSDNNSIIIINHVDQELHKSAPITEKQKLGKEDDVKSTSSSASYSNLCILYKLNRRLRRLVSSYSPFIRKVILIVLLLAYLAFFAYCMYHEFGNEPSIRLLVGTLIGLWVVIHYQVKRINKHTGCCSKITPPQWLAKCLNSKTKEGKRLRKIIKWTLYLASGIGAVALVITEVVLKRPQNLTSLAGIVMIILVCFVFSTEPEKINWHTVFWGMSLQFWFAVFIRKTEFGSDAFGWLADRVVEFLQYTDKGSRAVFGDNFLDHRFIFQMMPTMIFFNAVISMLYYLGLVQLFIATFGKFLSYCLGTSPIESVNAAANLFLTLSEAPIIIKPFMQDITRSELFAVMTGGFASIAGSLLWAFAAYGAPVKHILTASVMSAPAALAIAKLMYPDERKPTVKAEDAYKVDVGHYGSLLGALSKGASDGLQMVGFVVVNLLIYVALLEFLDQTLLWFTERAGVEGFTFSKLIAYVFYPVTFLMGFEVADCFLAAKLLGVKILTTTTLTFIDLGHIITNSKALRNYTTFYPNDTWSYRGDDVILHATNQTLVGGIMSERSGILATYMLCGLSNMGAIGIAIGAFSALAPMRTTDVVKQVPLALLAGNIASFCTACVAGLLHTDGVD